MFRDMRRKKQLLSKDESLRILETCTAGVLGVIGDEGYPYTVPMSYVIKDNKIFMHSAKQGHKIDSIGKNNKVSFCVIDKNQVVQETFTTHFRSVQLFGKGRILENDEEKREALEALVEKYSPDFIEKGQHEITRDWERVSLIEIEIEHMTGKAAIEIINK